MHFSFRWFPFKIFQSSFLSNFLIFSLLVLSQLETAESHKGPHPKKKKENSKIKGVSYIDNEKPYKSYVGKILPNKNDDSLSNILGKYSTDEINFPHKTQGKGRGSGQDRKTREDLSKMIDQASTQKGSHPEAAEPEESIFQKAMREKEKFMASGFKEEPKSASSRGRAIFGKPSASPANEANSQSLSTIIANQGKSKTNKSKIRKGAVKSKTTAPPKVKSTAKPKPTPPSIVKSVAKPKPTPPPKGKAAITSNIKAPGKNAKKEDKPKTTPAPKGNGTDKDKGRGMNKEGNDGISKIIEQAIKEKARFIAKNFKDGGGSGGNDKPTWFLVGDPPNLLGRTVTGYEPADPKEPRPSERVDKGGGRMAEEYEADNNGDDGKDDTGGDKDDEEGEDSKPFIEDKSKPEDSGSGDVIDKPFGPPPPPPEPSYDGDRKLPVVVNFGDAKVDPNAPGWFALKPSSDFGKELQLGTLLRRTKNDTLEDDDNDLEMDDVYDAEDGLNDDGSEGMSSLLRKYDKACLWQEYQESKALLEGSDIGETIRQKVKWQNEQLSYFFLNIAMTQSIKDFKTSPLLTQVPTGAFELLHMTAGIFINNICKDVEYSESDDGQTYDPSTDKILPKPFSETTYAMFLRLYELTKNHQTQDYLSEKEMSWIKANLEQCNQTGGMPKKIKWFVDECKETVVAFDQENNYACTPYLEYDFNIRKYDPLLDYIWHMIAAVHSHCFESFQTNIRMWHRYALAMADLFTVEMRLRWTASTQDNKKLYVRLFGPHYETFFDNMNRCMYAATLRSNVPYLLPRFVGNRRTRFAPYYAQEIKDDGAAAAAPS